MLGDDAPIAACIGRTDGFALKEDAGGTGNERSIDNIGMADHPADIGCRPKHLSRLDAEHMLQRPCKSHHMPAIVAHDTFGFTGSTRCVKHIKRIGGSNGRARDMTAARRIHSGTIVDIAAFNRLMRMLLALQDNAVPDRVAGSGNRLVEHCLIGHNAGWFDAA